MLRDFSANNAGPLLSEASRQFLEFARVELQFSPQTNIKYGDCLRQVIALIGERYLNPILLGGARGGTLEA